MHYKDKLMKVTIFTDAILDLEYTLTKDKRAYFWEGNPKDLINIIKNITAEYTTGIMRVPYHFHSTIEMIEFIEYITYRSLLRKYESKL